MTSWLDPARWHSEFEIILKRGLALGAELKPDLVRQPTAIVKRAARTQGRRFLIAELSAVSRGDYALADGYREVLRKLRQIGLSPAYTLTTALLTNRFGRFVLSIGARLRRARARRFVESFDRKAARA